MIKQSLVLMCLFIYSGCVGVDAELDAELDAACGRTLQEECKCNDSSQGNCAGVGLCPACEAAIVETYIFKLHEPESARKIYQLAQVDVFDGGDVYLTYEKNSAHQDSTRLTRSRIPLSQLHYSYFKDLLKKSGVGETSKRIGELVFDGLAYELEIRREGRSLFFESNDFEDEAGPFTLSAHFLFDLGSGGNKQGIRMRSFLAYYKGYDEVCLKIDGSDFAAQREKWSLFKCADQFYKEYGFPHEVNTRCDGFEWGYYLKGRTTMIVSFLTDGTRDESKRVLYTEYDQDIPFEMLMD